ncbi:Afadin and alpha-actinin-binding-domain-containing protein [Syncephalis fuscata]|nr:Afadin and alpha-actinin-binding-domain-containing protein [Syncephalis fuscata]
MSDEEQATWEQSYFTGSTPYKGGGVQDYDVDNASTPLRRYTVHSGGYQTPTQATGMMEHDDFSVVEEGQGDMTSSLFELAHERQRNMDYREEMEDSYRRIRIDNEQLTANLTKYKQLAEQSDRDVATWRIRFESAESNYRGELEKHKYSKEELRLFKLQMQQARSQYAFDVRKRDLEMGRLKEKMQRYMTDRSKTNKVGLKLLNHLGESQRTGVSGTRSNQSSGEGRGEEFYKRVLHSLQQREKEFIQENEQLRGALRTLYQEVSSLLVSSAAANAPPSPSMAQILPNDGDIMDESGIETSNTSSIENKAVDTSLLTADTTTTAITSQMARIDLPSSMAGTSIAEEVRDMVARLRVQWEAMTLQALAPIDAEVLATKEQVLQEKDIELEALRRQLDEYSYVIKEQEKLMDLALSPDMVGDQYSVAGDSTINEITETEMGQRYQELKRQQDELNAERETFTDAAVKLGLEREQLLRERYMFEEEKRRIEMERVLDILPDTPQ